jgi:hypothetical protein
MQELTPAASAEQARELQELKLQIEKLTQQLMQVQDGGSQGPAANAAAAASSSSEPETLEESMELACNYSDMLKAFMHANRGLVWSLLTGAMLGLRTHVDDRPFVVLALSLYVVATMSTAENTVMDGMLPKLLPPDLPVNLKRMLEGLLREIREPYRKQQLHYDASGWNAMQRGWCFLQQQLFGIKTTQENEVAYEDALQGLDSIANSAVGFTRARENFFCMLVTNRTADVIRFAENWADAQELSPKARVHLLWQVTELAAPKVAAKW